MLNSAKMLLFAGLLACFSSAADAEVFACVNSFGQTEYSATSCGDASVELSSRTPVEALNVQMRYRIYAIDQEIKRVEAEIETIKHSRNEKLLLAEASGLGTLETQQAIGRNYAPPLASMAERLKQLRMDRRKLMDRLL